MILDEQVYCKSNKIYWHGSLYSKYNKDLAKFKYYFITPDFEYAARYALDRVNVALKYMYACTLKRPLNIFNPRSITDELKFRKRYNPTNEEFEILKNEPWLEVYGSIKDRERIVDSIQLLGYDGFFNYEYNKEGASIGLFDPEDVKILRVYEGQEILDFVNTHEDLCRRRIRQREDLKRSCYKIMPSLLSKDDFKELLRVDTNFEEEYDNILRRRREHKLEKAKKELEEYRSIDKKNPLYEQILRSYELDFEDLYSMICGRDRYRLCRWEDYQK